MHNDISARLSRRFDPTELRAIKRLWVRHSIAEDRRDIDGLVATIAPNGEYEMVPTRQHWYGHAGVRAYYTQLFAAFPDNRFEMTDIVIGPQGVFESCRLTATNLGPWAGIPASGLPVDLEVLILFPWDPQTRLFTGEKIWFDSAALDLALGGSGGETRGQG
jgi:predicted ester cyclase